MKIGMWGSLYVVGGSWNLQVLDTETGKIDKVFLHDASSVVNVEGFNFTDITFSFVCEKLRLGYAGSLGLLYWYGREYLLRGNGNLCGFRIESDCIVLMFDVGTAYVYKDGFVDVVRTGVRFTPISVYIVGENVDLDVFKRKCIVY